MANPAITTVMPPGDGTYGPGQDLDFFVTFDQSVTVTGAPRLTLTVDTGGTVYADYVSGMGTSTLTFRYTVQTGVSDQDGIQVASLDLNGGAIENAPDAADLTLNSVFPTDAILIDGVAPTVTSVAVPANGTYAQGQNLDFTVNFDEGVGVDTVGGTPRLALALDTGGTVYADYLSGSGTSAVTFRHVVQNGEQDLSGISIGALSTNGGAIRDAGGNDVVTTLNNVGATTSVLVDGIGADVTPPTVTSVDVPTGGTYTTGQALEFTVHFDEAITVGTGGGTPKINLTLDTGGTREAPYVSGSGTNALVFRYTVQGGDADANGITVGAMSTNGGTLRDAAGNNAVVTLNSVGSTAAVLVNPPADAIAPTVTSVTAPANGTYRTGQSLDFTVNFDEAVTVDTTGGTPRIALTLDTGGTVYATYQSGSGTSALIFSYTVQSGQADADGITVGALSTNGGTIRDAAANSAGLALNSVGSTAAVLVDGVVDVSIAAASANKAEGSGGGTTAFTFLLTRDDTTGSASVDYVVTGSGGSPANAADFGGTLPSGTASFAGGEATKTLTFYVTADTTVEPTEGFTVTLSNPTNLTIGTASASGQIVNDDAAPPVEDPAPQTIYVTESNGGNYTGSADGENLVVSSARADVRGMDGDDSVSISSASGGSANGNAGSDTLDGGAGSDTLHGGKDRDSVSGGAGDDQIYGDQGDDVVNGGDGADTVLGGDGADIVRGGDGDDPHINGNAGNDRILGGAGRDTVYGGQGDDYVYGDEGADQLSGDLGNDFLYGGAGADRFVFGPNSGMDWMTDFNGAEGDRIVLAPGQAFSIRDEMGTVIDFGGGNLVRISYPASAFDPSWIVYV